MQGLTDEEQQELILSVKASGVARRKLGPIAVAEFMNRALQSGETRQSLAKALGFTSPTMIGRFVRLLELAPLVRCRVSWPGGGGVAFSTAAEIARLSPDEQSQGFDAVSEHGLTALELKQLVQRRARAHESFAESLKSILALRPLVEQRYIFIGSINEQSGKLLEAAGETQVVLRALIRERLSDEEVGVSLRGRAFTISTTANTAGRINQYRDFEETLAKWISEGR